MHCAVWELDWAEHLGGPQGQPPAVDGGQNPVLDHRVVPAWVPVLQTAAHLVVEGCIPAVEDSSGEGKAGLAGVVDAAGRAHAASAASH